MKVIKNYIMLPAILTQRFLVIKAFSILSLCLILDTRRVSSASSTARLCNNSERRELQHILQLVTKNQIKMKLTLTFRLIRALITHQIGQLETLKNGQCTKP